MTGEANSIKNHFKLWLQLQKAGNDLVPTIQRLFEEAEWQAETWDAIRPEAPEGVKTEVDERLARAAETLRTQLPLPPQYGSFLFGTVATTVTSGTMSTYSAILRVEDLKCIAPERAEPFIIQYVSIQARNDREAETRRRLVERFPALVQRFDGAAAAVDRAKSQREQIPLAAVEARTVLDELKGELWKEARRAAGEKMDWELMSGRLGAVPDRTSASQILRDQGTHRSDLYSRLSELAKHREGRFAQDISVLWPLVLDHIFVICGSIRGTAP